MDGNILIRVNFHNFQIVFIRKFFLKPVPNNLNSNDILNIAAKTKEIPMFTAQQAYFAWIISSYLTDYTHDRHTTAADIKYDILK